MTDEDARRGVPGHLAQEVRGIIREVLAGLPPEEVERVTLSVAARLIEGVAFDSAAAWSADCVGCLVELSARLDHVAEGAVV